MALASSLARKTTPSACGNAYTGIQTMSPLEGHSDSVNSVAFSPDGTRIVSGSYDNTIRVWNAYTGIQTMSPLEGHSEDINNVPISTHSARTLPGHSHAHHQLAGPKVHPQSCRHWAVPMALREGHESRSYTHWVSYLDPSSNRYTIHPLFL
ncbi:hypothetical protein HGRIS_004237 [Hohenbuehelia grisea]|uniref:WD40 repeat-like protein n=1 Tax=Hohenbuehelia grisea TaxID=104357 RepID=A0ABR3IP66_9AGAR